MQIYHFLLALEGCSYLHLAELRRNRGSRLPTKQVYLTPHFLRPPDYLPSHHQSAIEPDPGEEEKFAYSCKSRPFSRGARLLKMVGSVIPGCSNAAFVQKEWGNGVRSLGH